VWIDSICINQEDDHERAQQVQLMKRVYQQSTRTVVWLGVGTAQTDSAMRFLRELAAPVRSPTREVVPAAAT
ncbi:heterokaryon incompatibility, partial [Lasiosphaeris hirsuta]